MTKTLNIAYAVLSDPEKRKNYNRILRFSNGKDYGQNVNDASFSNKINMSYNSRDRQRAEAP